MPSRQPIPRIRVELVDDPLRNMSPSSTLDITDILNRVQQLPNLLAEDFAFNDPDGPLYLEQSCLQDLPPFPMGRQPPLFILHSHRTRLPFHVRAEAFELDDFPWDEEDTRLLLTAPTMPRMKLVIKERVYVQKWVDNLTPINPPRHSPWTYEKPGAHRKWIKQGSIFPAAGARSSTEQLGSVQGHDDRSAGLADQVPHSGDLCVLSEASTSLRISTDPCTSTSHALVKSAGVDDGILREEPSTLQTPHCIGRAPQASSPPSLLPSGPQTRMTPITPLAARRGKSLSGLKLKGNIIEQLEYPDIPTAFLGTPSVWSPRFDPSSISSFTDHKTMLLDLTAKCAAIERGPPTYIQNPLCPGTDTIHVSLSVDEWAFTRGLATFDDNLSGSNDVQHPQEIIADTSISLPDDASTPTRPPDFSAHLGFAPRLHSTPAPRTPIKSSCGPPGLPLPPRPALVSPLTPPYVRGILKKVKSVRFEDMIIKESLSHALPVIPLLQISPESPSPMPLIVSSERPHMPTPTTVKPASTPTPLKETPALGDNIQEKKSALRSRLPPKRTKVNGKLGSRRPNAAGSSKATLVPNPFERPCRLAHAKENTNPGAAVTQVHAKQRGLDGPPKSRLPAPLRNIFRFR